MENLRREPGDGTPQRESATIESTPHQLVDLSAKTIDRQADRRTAATPVESPPISRAETAIKAPGLSTGAQAIVPIVVNPQLLDPVRIGRYMVVRCLGQGGMGTVYAAYDPDLDRKVAVKVVRNNVHQGQIARERLLKEAKAMARIAHPNVVHVYEVGEDRESPQGQIFIAMEFVPGSDLVEWQNQHPVRDATSLDHCLRTYLQAAAGLSAAHNSGLIHRDFKPDNVIVGSDGRARVMDFGIARAPDDSHSHKNESPEASQAKLRTTSERLTQFGAILGTPGYMAPEQVRGEQADARSDQFGFCAALFEAIYGFPAFAGTTLEEYAASIRSGKPSTRTKTLHGYEVPLVIHAALMRGLSIDPMERFPSMQELTEALQAGLLPDADSESMRQNKRRFLHVMLSSFSVIVLGVLLALGGVHRSDLRPALLIATALLSVTSLSVAGFRQQIHQQPGYRRLGYFMLATMSYLVFGRSIGVWLDIPADRFLIQETVGLGALFASEMPHVGRRYGWIVALCLFSVLLQVVWPAGRRLHLNLTYGVMLFLTIYLRFDRGTLSHRSTPQFPDGTRRDSPSWNEGRPSRG